MPTTLQQLLDLQRMLVNDKMPQAQRRQLVVNDTDGRTVRLTDPDIIAVLDRRIEAESRSSAGGSPAPAAGGTMP